MFWLRQLNPANEFKKHFELVPAETSELRDEVYRIRHHVYCEEFGFEAVNAKGREQDEYDGHAHHLLLRCMSTGAWAGCVRLVLTPSGRPELPLPSEKICAAMIDPRLFSSARFPRENVAEISRLALVREFRRMRPERKTGSVAPTDDGTPTHSRPLYLRLGLYLGAIALAHHLGIKALLFLTDPRLASRLRQFGFPIVRVGDPVEHRGTRVLSMAPLDDPIQRLPFYMRPLYRTVERDIAKAFDPGPVNVDANRYAGGRARIRVGHSDVGNGDDLIVAMSAA